MPLRLGDDVDDFCPKCKRLTNHSIVSMVEEKPAKVRCRTCYHEQMFRDGVPPPSKKDLKKAELFNEVLGSATVGQPAAAAEESPKKSKKPAPQPEH